MKNLTYMPLIKNRYFYGKLLTAEDFQQEQRYGDDRRRMINRWMLGVGVAAGLEVIRVDDYHISVEMGLALDYTGREILVDAPVIKKMSALDGYEEATRIEGAESLYLCIEYAQTPIEPVHNITDRAVHTVEEETYNKYQESYHLYVTDDEPEDILETEGSGDAVRFLYDRAEKIHQGTFRPGVYLARIELVKAGSFYMIDQITPLPFGEWVCSQPYVAGRLRELEGALQKVKKTPEGRGAEGLRPETAEPESDWQFAQGMTVIQMPEGGKQGRCLFSEEIPHGLGVGDVEVMVRVVQGNYSFSGAEDIFDDYEKKAEAAVRADRKTGTFKVGIRFLEDSRERELSIGWTAIRKRSRNEISQEEERIYIYPGLVNIKTREQVQLEAVCVNMEQPELVWTVVTPEGGTIGETGCYHAPSVSGVYEVNCSKKENPGIKASVFIVVRE